MVGAHEDDCRLDPWGELSPDGLAEKACSLGWSAHRSVHAEEGQALADGRLRAIPWAHEESDPCCGVCDEPGATRWPSVNGVASGSLA